MRLDSFHFHRFDGFLDDVVMRLDFFSHIVVLVLDFDGCRAFAIFEVYEVSALLYHLLLVLEKLHVVVADDI